MTGFQVHSGKDWTSTNDVVTFRSAFFTSFRSTVEKIGLVTINYRGAIVEYHVLSPEEFQLLCEGTRMLAYNLFKEGGNTCR